VVINVGFIHAVALVEHHTPTVKSFSSTSWVNMGFFAGEYLLF
jgi:hypothetical protein